MNFSLLSHEGQARAGIVETDHGNIETPIFMPVGTQATVKALNQDQLRDEVRAQIILANTYHLYLRPGMEILKEAGGVHRFMDWDRPMLTDSGGFQIFSLSDRRKLSEEGAMFYSHIDGSRHFFTPENVMETQRIIGADIIMALDECTPYPCDKKYAEKSMQRTHRWLQRCAESFGKGQGKYGHRQALFPIVQGSVYPDLRKKSAEYVSQLDLPGNAIGGLSVGEPAADMYAMTEVVCEILPWGKPRYLMGVGTPMNLLESIDRGIDMFDCVLPTRNARNGMLFTWDGIINIKNTKWKRDFSPISASAKNPMSLKYSKAYLRHLFQAKEILALEIASVHNLSFYLELMEEARNKILDGSWSSWKTKTLEKIARRL